LGRIVGRHDNAIRPARLPCFAGEVDYVRYRQELQEAALRHGCAIHAYVLMTNHVHLLVSPASEGAVSRIRRRSERT
jgi:putative transposase